MQTGSTEYLKTYVYLKQNCSCLGLLKSFFLFSLQSTESTELIIIHFFLAYLGIKIFRAGGGLFLTSSFLYDSKHLNNY